MSGFGIDVDSMTDDQICAQAKEYIMEKEETDFSPGVLEKIDQVTMQLGVFPAGSYKLAAVKYPGDVDIFERMFVVSSRQEAKEIYATLLQDIAINVNGDETLFWSDFKSGIDPRFIPLIEALGTPTKSGTVPPDYSGELVQKELGMLLSQGVIDQATYDVIYQRAYNYFQDFENWLELRQVINSTAALRWSINEVMAGEKILPGLDRIPLQEALEDSFTKIDVIAPVSGNGFTELTNVFYFTFQNQGGFIESMFEILAGYETFSSWVWSLFGYDRSAITLSEPLPERLLNLENDVLKYSSGEHRSPTKAIKRMFTLAKATRDWQLLVKLGPLLNMPPVVANQVIAESEAIRVILDQTLEGNLPLACTPNGLMLKNQISKFRKKITSSTPAILVAESGLETLADIGEAASEWCPDSAFNEFENIATEQVQEMSVSLTFLEGILKPMVDESADVYIESSGIDLVNVNRNFSDRKINCGF